MTRSPDPYFDSDLIARLSKLELTARRLVDGFLAGKNKSSRHGFSVEFVEHREYVPGDDLRHLDWKVLGRLDRYYIKRYEEETNITAILLLDCSRSMTYAGYSPRTQGKNGPGKNGPGKNGQGRAPASRGEGAGAGLSKFELAASAASALGYLLNRQRDAVGLLLFDEEVRAWVPPSVRLSSLAGIVSRLKGTEPKGKSSLEGILKKMAPELPGRCLFILLSDLFLPSDEIAASFKQLHYQGHDVVVLQTLDPAEKDFPFRTNLLFRGLEDDRKLLAEPQRLRKAYLDALEKFLDDVRREAESCAFDYRLLAGQEELGPVLASLLALRQRSRRLTRRGGS